MALLFLIVPIVGLAAFLTAWIVGFIVWVDDGKIGEIAIFAMPFLFLVFAWCLAFVFGLFPLPW